MRFRVGTLRKKEKERTNIMKRILIAASLMGIFWTQAEAQTSKKKVKRAAPVATPVVSEPKDVPYTPPTPVKEKEIVPSPPPAGKHSLYYSLDSDYQLDGRRWENEHFLKYTYLI